MRMDGALIGFSFLSLCHPRFRFIKQNSQWTCNTLF
jgi:hypothetical protein